VDLYYNYQLVQQSEEVFDDIEITQYEVYLKKFNPKMNGYDVYSIQNLREPGMRFCFEVKQLHGPYIHEKWELIGFNNIKQYVKVATDM
jgi:hypothetical protein